MRHVFNRRSCTLHSIIARAFRLAVGVAAVVLLVQTPPARAGDEQLIKAGAANRPLLLREHAAWNMDCHGVPYPALRIDRPPRHGTVCARVADITIRYMYAGTESQCIGHVVQGLRLIYVPLPGFAGDDHFQYSVRYPSSARRRVSVIVSVGARVGAATLPADTVGAAPETAQESGPVPPCAAPVS